MEGDGEGESEGYGVSESEGERLCWLGREGEREWEDVFRLAGPQCCVT